jgi:hypothetical protein
MSFPLMPDVTSSLGPVPTVTYIGRNATTGDGFPSGSRTFTSGLKLIVVCCEPAGSPQASNVTVGGVSMTQAAQTGVVGGRSASVWYLETTMSGSRTISGSGGSGRSALDVYEVRGYSSATPYFTNTAASSTSVTSRQITAQTSTNSIVLGAGTGPFTTMNVTANQGPAPVDVTAAYESATSHFSWYQVPTWRGPTTYTASGSSSGAIVLALAAWR